MARKGQGIEIVGGWQEAVVGEDFLRELVQRTVQQVLEAEMTSFLGAASYQRNGERRGWRNGYKPRTLKTRVGELELMVPKDRDGEFQTELFDRYQRSEKALVLAMLQMYVEGVSTRKVSAITEALCGLEVSKSQVSALSQKLDAEVAEWRQRPLTEAYPYLVIDARYEKVRRGGAVVSPFTVLFTTSTKGAFPAGRAYGYVHFQPGPGVVASFNSAGGANTVAPGPTGVWTVKMAGLGSVVALGGIQVTAVNPSVPAKCELNGWAWTAAGQVFQVRCFDAGSTPLKTGWTLSYQRKRAVNGAQPKRFAYTFDNKPLLAGPYAPAPAGVNFNSLSGVNAIRSAGGGLRLVQFPRVGTLPNTVLVTPFHAGPGFCNLLSPWATAGPTVIVRDVACYTAAGALKNRASMVTYAAAH